MKQLLVLSLAVWLMACSTHYLKPDVTRQAFDLDYEACSRQAKQEMPTALSVGRWFFTPAVVAYVESKKARVHDCMQAKGYARGNSGFKEYE